MSSNVQEATLEDVCSAVRQRMCNGESWGPDLFRRMAEHPGILQAIRRQAERRRWIDRSVGVEELSLEVAGVLWERLPRLRWDAVRNCPSFLMGFIRKCFWHLPASKMRRRDEMWRESAGAVLVADGRVEAGEVDVPCEPDVLAEYQEEMLESVVQSAIRSLPQNQAIALRLMVKHDFSQKDVAETLGVAESTVGELVKKARTTVKEKINDWRMGFGEVTDEKGC